MKTELLNKLVEQASAHASEQNERFGVSFKDTFNEKLAELIAQECINIVDDEGCGEGGSIRAIKKIQEHFGVDA